VTDDQQFILGLATVLSTTVIQALAFRKLHQNSELLDGLGVKRERRAHRAGAALQRKTDAHARASQEN
jgi:hypothetical protein